MSCHSYEDIMLPLLPVNSGPKAERDSFQFLFFSLNFFFQVQHLEVWLCLLPALHCHTAQLLLPKPSNCTSQLLSNSFTRMNTLVSRILYSGPEGPWAGMIFSRVTGKGKQQSFPFTSNRLQNWVKMTRLHD